LLEKGMISWLRNAEIKTVCTDLRCRNKINQNIFGTQALVLYSASII